MNVLIAGGHGKIALRLAGLLSGRGDQVTGFIRNPGHADDVARTGARPLVLDLERSSLDDVTAALGGAPPEDTAVVFAAGAGPGSGPARKDTVDRAASVLLAEAAERAGVRRFLQISSMNAGRPARPGSDEAWAAYLKAKGEAEDDLRARDLDWLIVRPGRLTDAPGTGLVRLAEPDIGHGEVTRDDVAAVLAALLAAPQVHHRVLDLLNGPTPVQEAVAALG